MTSAAKLEINGKKISVLSRTNGKHPITRGFFRLLGLLSAFAYLSVWTTGYLHEFITVLAVPFLLALIFARPLPFGRILLQIGSVVALLHALAGRNGPLPGVILLLQFTGTILLLQILVLDCLRAAHGVIVLSLMMVLAVAAMNVNFVFPLVLCPYLLVFYFVLRDLAVFRHRALANGSLQSSPASSVYWQRFLLGAVVSMLIFAFLWLVMFYLMPRSKSFGIASEVSRRRLKGFSDMMQLGSAGLLEDNPAVIMRVRPIEEKTNNVSILRRIGSKLLRGATFASYRSGSWEKGTKRRWYIDLRRLSGELRLDRRDYDYRDLHQLELVQENLDPAVIFRPEQTVSMNFTQRFIAYEEDLSFYFLQRHSSTRRYIANVLLKIPEIQDSLLSEIESTRDTQPYLDVQGIPERVKELAKSLAGDSRTIAGRADRIMAFLRDDFEYSLVQEPLAGKDPVEDFLLESKQGSCEHFASAMALLLRSQGIPARPVGGYTMGEWNEVGGFYTVRQRHAHAWVEVFFPRSGWVSYDPTPPSLVGGPETEFEILLQSLWDTYEGYWFKYVYSFDDKAQGLGFRRILSALSHLPENIVQYLMNPFLWLSVVIFILLSKLQRAKMQRVSRGVRWIPDWYSSWETSLPVSRHEWETPAEYHGRLLSQGVISLEQSDKLGRLAELVDEGAFSHTADHAQICITARAVLSELTVYAQMPDEKSG